jgi:hypothetical protein
LLRSANNCLTGKNMDTRMGQLHHFAFIDGGSWYFLLGAVVMVMMGLYSVHKANALYVKR